MGAGLKDLTAMDAVELLIAAGHTEAARLLWRRDNLRTARQRLRWAREAFADGDYERALEALTSATEWRERARQHWITAARRAA